MYKYPILILFVITFSSSCYTQVVLNNSNCRNAYEDILSLKFDDARSKIIIEKQLNPNNVFIYYLENYIDFLTVTISEDESIFDSVDNAITFRINKIKELDDSSPYKNYFLGNINLQWATANLRFKNYATGALEINRAYRLLVKNNEDFPDFFPNAITLGVLHVMIGIVPDSFNWLLNLVSMSGTVEEGRKELLMALEKSSSSPKFNFLENEILFYLGMVDLNLSPDPELASHIIAKIDSTNNESLLLSYLAINGMMKNGRNEEALAHFEKIDFTLDYYPFYYLNYIKGECYLRKLNTKLAREQYEIFVVNFSGTNYVKDAWRKIGWCALIEGDTAGYLNVFGNIIIHGEEDIDADKNAQTVAEEETIPMVELIKARLLSDGGYYWKADSVLNSINNNTLTEIQQVEKSYRLGRIDHKSNNLSDAIDHYIKTIDRGISYPQYFAANSALKLGNIYEIMEDYDNAKVYYELCLGMDFNEYRNSIRGKAKQGLERVSSQ